ncbi:MAG TPA: SpoIIE family protein phosphatase [bacterium]|jgi:serine phosphatase RsbU (regulator of sigma subunit)
MRDKIRRRGTIVLPDFGVWAQLAITLAGFTGILLIGAVLRLSFPGPEIFLFIYLPVVGGMAYFVGRAAGLATALLAIGAAAYFLFAPAGAFDLPSYLITVGLFALMVLLTALAPAHLRDREREAERGDQRLWLLADASAMLGATLKYDTSLKDVARAVVPGFADWCIVELVGGSSGATHLVAIAHADPAKVGMLGEIHRAELLREGSDSAREAFVSDPRHLSLLRAVGTKAVLRVPFRHNHQIDGVITFGRGNAAPRFDLADQVFAEDLGRRCGMSIALGRADEFQRKIIETLQRNLLPQQLPDLPAAAVSARYIPANTMDIGGDWYDVIPLPDGRIGLAIGDVSGRGVEAAALMGQLRTALHVLALDGHPPSAVLHRVDNLLQRLPLRMMATGIYMVVSSEAMRISFANAGHPPPLVVKPDGTTRFLMEGRTVPLGVGISRPPEEAEVPLPENATLVFYTDGLVERRGAGIDHGLAELEEVVRGGPIDPAAVCERVVQEMVADRPLHDDVALLAAQFERKSLRHPGADLGRVS